MLALVREQAGAVFVAVDLRVADERVDRLRIGPAAGVREVAGGVGGPAQAREVVEQAHLDVDRALGQRDVFVAHRLGLPQHQLVERARQAGEGVQAARLRPGLDAVFGGLGLGRVVGRRRARGRQRAPELGQPARLGGLGGDAMHQLLVPVAPIRERDRGAGRGQSGQPRLVGGRAREALEDALARGGAARRQFVGGQRAQQLQRGRHVGRGRQADGPAELRRGQGRDGGGLCDDGRGWRGRRAGREETSRQGGDRGEAMGAARHGATIAPPRRECTPAKG